MKLGAAPERFLALNQEYEMLAPAVVPLVTPEVIHKPYLMVTFIPCFLDEEGTVWLDQGWHHDLIEHLTYLKDFALCGPRLPKGSQANLLPIVVPEDVRFRYIELPSQTTAAIALRNIPNTMRVLWRAVGESDIVHSSVIGWPYPLGWIVNPFAVIRRKALVIVVESSWRSTSPKKQTWLSKTWDFAKEWVAQWSCRHAAVAFFTQPTYRDLLYRGTPGRGYVTPAVWINAADVLCEADARRSWDSKIEVPVRMLFAGRLAPSKGVDILLDALRILDRRGIRTSVDIIGEGALRQSCVDAAAELSCVQLSVLDQVPYGEPFFKLVRSYHALLIPSVSDEQPRVVFDANAQAVPVIASNTPGLQPHIEDGRTGWLIESGKAEVLAEAMERAIHDPQALRSMGMASLAATSGYTHIAMHRTRSRILKKHVSSA